MLTRILGGLLLAVGVRMLVTGPAPTNALVAGVIAMLLVADILLMRQGRKLEPTTFPQPANVDQASAEKPPKPLDGQWQRTDESGRSNS